MEGKPSERILQDENVTEELLLDAGLDEIISEKEIAKKSIEELTKDEEILTTYLINLKKENFKLEVAVKAWKTALKEKLEEFKETNLKLDEMHKEIQSEREDFCSKLDNFNDNYGVLSTWWEKQMNYLNEVENLGDKYFEQEKCKKEIQKLEQEIEDIKNKRKNKEVEKVRNCNDVVSPKKSKTLEDERKEFEIVEKMFSLVDVKKVRMANRRMNKRKVFIDKK